MGTSFFCPNAFKESRTEMLICRLDRCLCDKQQYCPAKRMYENTAGIGNCKKRTMGLKKENKEEGPETES